MRFGEEVGHLVSGRYGSKIDGALTNVLMNQVTINLNIVVLSKHIIVGNVSSIGVVTVIVVFERKDRGVGWGLGVVWVCGLWFVNCDC